jgi:hypothetical protein
MSAAPRGIGEKRAEILIALSPAAHQTPAPDDIEQARADFHSGIAPPQIAWFEAKSSNISPA